MSAVRVQLSRAKGWRMPPNTVKVDRSTKSWGNPYRVVPQFMDEIGIGSGAPQPVGYRVVCSEWTSKMFFEEDNALAEAVRLYRAMHDLDEGRRIPGWEKLVGKNLACWCDLDEPCHADVMLELVAKWAAEPRWAS